MPSAVSPARAASSKSRQRHRGRFRADPSKARPRASQSALPQPSNSDGEGALKALFVGLPLHGHVNPSLCRSCALVDRGEEIVYFATEPFAAAIEQVGARPSLSSRRPVGSLADVGSGQARWRRSDGGNRAAYASATLDAFRDERPDYVIADSVAPWGQWAGQILGVPVVTSIPDVCRQSPRAGLCRVERHASQASAGSRRSGTSQEPSGWAAGCAARAT